MNYNSALWGNIFRSQQDEKSIAATLKRTPIFARLSKSELSLIENLVYIRNYNEDEIIFVEGEPGAGMYIIESGTVRICLGANTDEKNELAKLEAGDFFGELALIDDAPRSATAVAITPCRLIGFFRTDLLSLINRAPRIGVKIQRSILEILVRRLRVTDRRLALSHDEIRKISEDTSDKETV